MGGAAGALIALRQRMGVRGDGGARLLTKVQGVVYTLHSCRAPLLDETVVGLCVPAGLGVCVVTVAVVRGASGWVAGVAICLSSVGAAPLHPAVTPPRRVGEVPGRAAPSCDCLLYLLILIRLSVAAHPSRGGVGNAAFPRLPPRPSPSHPSPPPPIRVVLIVGY